MTNRNSKQVVFITGASAGIGEALAKEAAQRGATVALFARRRDRLRSLAQQIRTTTGQAALELVGDVTNQDDLQSAVEQTLEAFGSIDAVVANAGFGVRGTLEALTLADYQRQFDTNVFGVLRTIYATLPALKVSTGMLGVVGSANGYLDVPGWSAYCMSKAALRSLCAATRHELADVGVSVTHLVPGMVKSEFRTADNFGSQDPSAHDPVPQWLAMPAATAAAEMLDAIFNREGERIITWHAKAVVALERHAHWLVSHSLSLSGPLIRRLSKK